METKNKKVAAALAPFRRGERGLEVYLQRRDKEMTWAPDKYGFFGGMVEGTETPEEAMVREIEEELCITPHGYSFLGVFETPSVFLSVYRVEVFVDFEKEVQVMEGQYGRFLVESEALSSPRVADEAKQILKVIFDQMR